MRNISLITICVLFLYIAGCSAGSGQWPKQITPPDALDMMEDGAVLLDVRTEEEFADGHIPGSALLPLGEVEDRIGQMIPDKGTVVIIYCRSGNRSKAAAELLVRLGYERVYDLGGIIDWPYEITE